MFIIIKMCWIPIHTHITYVGTYLKDDVNGAGAGADINVERSTLKAPGQSTSRHQSN
jgi:hypothetical protein